MAVTPVPASDLSTFLGPDPQVERLYDNVQAELPSVPLALIKMQAWNTVEDFYINSGYRREAVFWQMAAGEQVVDFNPFDENWLVAWIAEVEGLSNFKIDPPGRLVDLNTGTGTRNGRALLLLKPPNFSTDGCGCLGSELWSNWFEVILQGVLARLYKMPAKPWSSPQLAQVAARQYLAGRARARGVAEHGYTNGGGRWRFPMFAPGRRKN